MATIEGFHPPTQERGWRTLRRMVEATEALIEERGPGGVTVKEVTARADASVGAFYARFDSKEAALTYVRRSFWREARRLWSGFLSPDRWEGLAASVVVAETLRRFARFFFHPSRRSRAFLLGVLTDAGAEARREVAGLDRFVADRLVTLLEAVGCGRRGGDLAPRTARATPAVLGSLRDHLLFSHRDLPHDGDREDGRSLSDVGGDRSEQERILGVVQMFGLLVGVDSVPRDYAELLELCKRAGHVRFVGREGRSRVLSTREREVVDGR